MKTPRQLINNIIGQLNGVNRMIDEGRDCLTILIQLRAAKSALEVLSSKLIASDVLHCSAKLKNRGEALKIRRLLEELSKK